MKEKEAKGSAGKNKYHSLQEAVKEAFGNSAEIIKKERLHGDLWSGNMMCGYGGRPWIIDPAVYVGDFETDLAMTQLFGSLPEIFYAAYSEINPIDRKGYLERRRLYDLYHLLNNLNLFGTAYLGSVVEIIDEYAGSL